MKITNFEDVLKLKSNKLFEDLGYELVCRKNYFNPDCILWCYEDIDSRVICVKYNLKYHTYEITPYEDHEAIRDITLILYPLTKLCEELGTDIEEVYLNEVKYLNDIEENNNEEI